jgi:radical SAM superfamily enzyme YgiQ (UPF0313 family)
MNMILVSFQGDLDTIGLKYLHYCLLENGYNSHILYLPHFNPSHRQQLENIKKFLFEVNPSFIGISLMSTEYRNACQFSRFIKGLSLSIPIIWGGIHPTISPRNCLDYADYVCIGEGERTMLDIANALNKHECIKDINNICYLKKGSVQINTLYPLIQNPDVTPIYNHIPCNSFIQVDGNIVQLNKRAYIKHDRFSGRIYTIMTGRGCPFSCTYCCNNFISRLYHSNKIRRRNIPNVMRELEVVVRCNPEVEYINFLDDSFLACSSDYLREFCKVYKERIGKPFVVRVNPDYITTDRLGVLKDAGLSLLQVGFQSGSERICKEVYKRKISNADFLKAARIIKDLNIAVLYDLILDNPFETKVDRLETIETLMRIPKPYFLQPYSLVFYYGTELYEKAKVEFPECESDYIDKSYLALHKNTVNNIIILSSVVNKIYMRKILYLYKHYPKSWKLRIFLFIINLLTIFIFIPINCFRVTKLSQRGSYVKTFKALLKYSIAHFKIRLSPLVKKVCRWHAVSALSG